MALPNDDMGALRERTRNTERELERVRERLHKEVLPLLSASSGLAKQAFDDAQALKQEMELLQKTVSTEITNRQVLQARVTIFAAIGGVLGTGLASALIQLAIGGNHP